MATMSYLCTLQPFIGSGPANNDPSQARGYQYPPLSSPPCGSLLRRRVKEQ